MRLLNKEEIAKAQHQLDLKEFIEWGEERCPHTGEWEQEREKKDCPKCWQEFEQLVEG